MGRPAKHLYGLDRAGQSLVVRPNPNSLSREAIKRCLPVQKLCAVNPSAIHSSRRRLPTGAPVFCGRAVGPESPNSFYSYRWLVMAASKASRDDSEPFSSRPGGRGTRSVAAGDRAQSNRRSPAAPNADRRCSGIQSNEQEGAFGDRRRGRLGAWRAASFL